MKYTEEEIQERGEDAIAGVVAAIVMSWIIGLIPWCFDLLTNKQSLGVGLAAFFVLMVKFGRSHREKYGDDNETNSSVSHQKRNRN